MQEEPSDIDREEDGTPLRDNREDVQEDIKINEDLEPDTDADAFARPKTAPTKTENLDPLPSQDMDPAVAQQTPEQSRTKKLVAKSIETKIAQQY